MVINIGGRILDTVALKNNGNVAVWAQKLEQARIKKHLIRVEKSLRKHTPKALSDEQLGARLISLNWLHEYWLAGDFPINTLQRDRTPIFKDMFGNYCAVGYLLHKAGHDNYVNEIKKADNVIKVKGINDSRYLNAISSLGITKDEAARIQPGYAGYPWEDPSPVQNNSSLIPLAVVSLFIVANLFALLFFKEMNLKKSQKILAYLSFLFTSSMILVGIYGVLELVK